MQEENEGLEKPGRLPSLLSSSKCSYFPLRFPGSWGPWVSLTLWLFYCPLNGLQNLQVLKGLGKEDRSQDKTSKRRGCPY